MPALIFLAVAYQIQNIKWRYLFLVLTAISFVYNLYHGMWADEMYSIVIAMLLFMLTPQFSSWWKKRNDRNNPDSFWSFAKETWMLVKYNRYKLFFWVTFLIASISAVFAYTDYTDQVLLGSLLAAFFLIAGLKNLFTLIMPPEWFLHDLNTEYTFLSVLIAYWLSGLISQKLGVQFVFPMIMAAVLCLVGFFLIHNKNRYLIPGCSIVLSDIIWQIFRLIKENDAYSGSLITTVVILVLTMLIGLIWLVRKPGIFPIVYLVLFQLFRFSTFSYEATDHAMTNVLSVSEASDYMLYLVSWMYIVPLLFWMMGLREAEKSESLGVEPHHARINLRFENLKKQAGIK